MEARYPERSTTAPERRARGLYVGRAAPKASARPTQEAGVVLPLWCDKHRGERRCATASQGGVHTHRSSGIFLFPSFRVSSTLIQPRLQDFGLDASLARFSSEFLASLHLWLAVHAHRTRDSAHSPFIISHAEEACKVIRAMIPAPVIRPSLGASKSPKGVSVQPPDSQLPRRTTRGKAATRLKAPTRTTKTKVPPVTPKKRKALDTVSLNAAVMAATSPKAAGIGGQGKMEFDDFAKFIALIRRFIFAKWRDSS